MDEPLGTEVLCCLDCDLVIKVSYEIKQVVTPAGSKEYYYEKQREWEREQTRKMEREMDDDFLDSCMDENDAKNSEAPQENLNE